MNTFNVGIVHPHRFACIICCYSENDLDPQAIKDCVDRYFKIGVMTQPKMDQIFDLIVAGIRKDCGCEAVKVLADQTKTISYMGVSQECFGTDEGEAYGT